MSRHEVTAVNPAHKIIVGWDDTTFFIQVIDRKIEDAGDESDNAPDKFVYWAGLRAGEIFDVDDLIRHARPYATIPYELRTKLIADKKAGR